MRIEYYKTRAGVAIIMKRVVGFALFWVAVGNHSGNDTAEHVCWKCCASLYAYWLDITCFAASIRKMRNSTCNLIATSR